MPTTPGQTKAIEFVLRCERDFRMAAREMQRRRKLYRYKTSLVDRRQWQDVPEAKRNEVNAELLRLDASLKDRANRIRKHLIEEALASGTMDRVLAMKHSDAKKETGFTVLVREQLKNIREQQLEDERQSA